MKKASLIIAAAVAGVTGASAPQVASAQSTLFDASYKIASAKHDVFAKKQKERKPFSPAPKTEEEEVVAEEEVVDHSTMDHSQHLAMETSATDHSQMDHSSMAHSAHHHGEGMWMFEYRFMRMYMKGMLDGAKEVNPQDLLPPLDDMGMRLPADQDPYSDFVNADGDRETMVSEDMTMDMHMFMGMYAFTDRVTGMIMFNILSNEMNMTMQMPMDMDDPEGMQMNMPMLMESSGLGDTQAGISYKLDNYFLYNPLFTFLVNIPTGSIDEQDEVNGGKLPYSMQLGTGSYDFTSALSFKSNYENWGIGVEGSYTWRMKNEENYSRGDYWRLRGWASYDLNFDPISLTFRGGIDHTDTSMIEGRDEDIMENPMYYGGMRTDLRLGLSLGLPWGFMVESQFAFPLHEDLHGYQMKTDYMMEFAVQWMF